MTLPEQVAALRRTIRRLLTRRLSGRTSRPFTQLLALKAVALEDIHGQSALAERLGVDAPAASRLVERLVEDGLMKRGAGENRRCVRLEVTEAARSDLEILRAETLWVEEEAARHLSAVELGELKRLLDKLLTGLTQSHDTSRLKGEREE